MNPNQQPVDPNQKPAQPNSDQPPVVNDVAGPATPPNQSPAPTSPAGPKLAGTDSANKPTPDSSQKPAQPNSDQPPVVNDVAGSTAPTEQSNQPSAPQQSTPPPTGPKPAPPQDSPAPASPAGPKLAGTDAAKKPAAEQGKQAEVKPQKKSAKPPKPVKTKTPSNKPIGFIIVAVLVSLSLMALAVLSYNQQDQAASNSSAQSEPVEEAESTDDESTTSANETGSSANDERFRDITRDADARTLRTALEAYYTIGSSVYPALDQLNDEAFRAENFPSTDESSFTDPSGETSQLTNDPTARNQYIYEGQNCDSEGCEGYRLTIHLEASDEPVVYENMQ